MAESESVYSGIADAAFDIDSHDRVGTDQLSGISSFRLRKENTSVGCAINCISI